MARAWHSVLAVVSAGVVAGAVWGQVRAAGGGAAGAGFKMVPLPYSMVDASGNTWMVYANGMSQQQQGNAPLFSQLAQLSINNAAAGLVRPGGVRDAQQGKLDEKTGDLVLENLTIGGVPVTRRVLLMKDDNAVRYVDTFRNPGQREITITPNYNTNFNFGIQQGRTVTDARRKDAALGWAGLTHAGRAVYLAWGLSGGKVAPRINYPEGGNVLQVSFSLTIPAGKEVSLVHTHGTAENVDRGVELVTGVRGAKLLSGVPGAVRRTVVNMPQRSGLPEEIEILRGDTLDVLETRTGDQLRGTLKDATYPLKTSFGRVELPAARVVAILTVGRQRPMQLLVTDEGEIFGGTPERDFVTLQLSSGQALKVPVSQLVRAGYRKREGEAEEAAVFSRPSVTLRTGERMGIEKPAGELVFASRYGMLRVAASAVASVAMKGEESPVHVITLTDGSRFSGIMVTEQNLALTLDGAAGRAALSVPAASIARLSPSTMPTEPEGASAVAEDEQPEVRCAGEDVFRGAIDGSITVDTPFEGIEVRGDQVRRLARAEGTAAVGGGELQVTLWDGTTLTGQPRQQTIPIRLKGGLRVEVPLDLLEGYTNPQPRPSDEMATRVRELVTKLDADDFKVRESAQQALIATGQAVIPILRELKTGQSPEAQQRIEQILSQLDR